MPIHTIKSNTEQHYACMQTISLSNAFSALRFLKKTFQFQSSAEHHSKRWRVFSNYQLLVVVLAAMFLGSCQKDQLSDPAALNSTSSAASAQARWRRSSSSSSPSITNYGAVICPPSRTRNYIDFQQSVAGKLGVTCLRGGTPVTGNDNHPAILSSGYDVLLNFNTGTNQSSPSPFVSDISRYKDNLNKILASNSVKPVVAVIENEESNRYYYSGTAQQYINQLSAAIDVMHAKGIKVANGGITSQGLNYLVYYDFIDQHKNDSAQHFKDLVGIALQDRDTKDRGDFIDILLSNYARMNLDYVNFHWKGTSPDTYALSCVINYLKKRTGKPVISNELGQLDTNTNTLLAMIRLCTDKKFPYILWYSPDENTKHRETPLHHDDASLTTTGVAYKNYLAQ